jgi:hypothetical protein
MKFQKTMMWSALSVLAIAGTGCELVVDRHSHDEHYLQPQPVYVQPPVYVEPQPQYVYVQQAPPAIIVERRPAAPSAAHIWVDGYWNWENQRYTWQAGSYQLPPQPDVIWVAPRYENDAKGYRFTPGQWKKQSGNNNPGNGNSNNGKGKEH